MKTFSQSNCFPDLISNLRSIGEFIRRISQRRINHAVSQGHVAVNIIDITAWEARLSEALSITSFDGRVQPRFRI